ncbi:hypothetical protein [Chryseobacterium sp. OV279]|uniref:hypothetical protein n=1 Tax=Chryseobacterium sp. OV279 TaxID=1500285 RepID=UPI0009106AC1|nr:hypothetical protein [Chryseobacterium sp. OV279]SHF32687.1 hypothetical protein SAMN02787100_1670 [Chryseobacterium sp. OV279]
MKNLSFLGASLPRILLFFALFILISPKLYCQDSQLTNTSYSSYALSTNSQSFSYLSGGTGVSINGDDKTSGSIPLGFTFKFACLDYTNVYASSNGFLSFLALGFFDSNYNNSSAPTGKFLAPFWDDLDGTGGTASYKTEGVAPGRVFSIEWKNWKRSGNSSGSISFQIKLFEGTNAIQYIYKQESASGGNNISASIGLYDDNDSSKKRWLNNSSASPTASDIKTSDIASRPATNQVYIFTPPTNCSLICTGRTLLNGTGGTNTTDGMRVIMSGAGNLQILRNNKGQIYGQNNVLASGSSSPYSTPSSLGFHGIVLGIGKTQYTGGGTEALFGYTDGGRLSILSSTCQSSTGPDAQGFEQNVIRLKAVKNNLEYYLTVTYTYKKPDGFIMVDYHVDIPAGNTEEIKLAHGWDTYLSGNDKGPGFVYGKVPNLTVGVYNPNMEGIYEAFQYVSGVKWSGYYSASYSGGNDDLSNNLTFKNTIDPDAGTDNGIGISINFGSTAGQYNNKTKILFTCNAPNSAPVLTSTSIACANGMVNLNNFVTSLNPNPYNLKIVWRSGTTNAEILDPTHVNHPGTYIVSYKDTLNNCESPGSTFTITGKCSDSCVKSPSTATPEKFTKIGISGYEKIQNNWPDKIPNGFIAVESGFEGIVLTRTTPEKILKPIEGMLIYDTSKNCFSLYNGTAWKCIQKSCNE